MRKILLLSAALALTTHCARAADPAPFSITDIVRAPSGTHLVWSDAGAGFDYTVQARGNLTGDPWISPRTTFPWPLTTRDWLDPLTSPTTTTFYRVAAVPHAQRGLLLPSQASTLYTVAQINFALFFAGIPITVTNDVRVYRLAYETIDPSGGRTVASGALALPQAVTRALPLCSYQHGTLASRNEAPSRAASNEALLGVVLAATGYAAVLPDYLGLGDSTLTQPYHHAASEASAAVDCLRAARTWCAEHGVALSDQLFILGYSHGGHSTMALHRELEEFHAAEFPLTASAPMAGAYDLSGTMTDDFLSGRPMPAPYYFALLLASYQSVYHLADSLGDLLAPPYNTTLPPLLDGQHSGSEIDAVLPATVITILKPSYLEAFRTQPDHPLRQALRDNDLYRWTPKAPTQLFHCQGDADVLYANSVVALNSFHQRGATQVVLTDPNPAADHGDCVLPSLLRAKTWFDSMRH
jgi:hypothetical protein